MNKHIKSIMTVASVIATLGMSVVNASAESYTLYYLNERYKDNGISIPDEESNFVPCSSTDTYEVQGVNGLKIENGKITLNCVPCFNFDAIKNVGIKDYTYIPGHNIVRSITTGKEIDIITENYFDTYMDKIFITDLVTDVMNESYTDYDKIKDIVERVVLLGYSEKTVSVNDLLIGEEKGDYLSCAYAIKHLCERIGFSAEIKIPADKIVPIINIYTEDGYYTVQADNSENVYDIQKYNAPFVIREIEGGSCAITNYVGASNYVEVPKSVNGLTVVSIDEGAFKDCNFISMIVLPNSLNKIENGAFENCTSIKYLDNQSNVIIDSSNFGDTKWFNKSHDLIEFEDKYSNNITIGASHHRFLNTF